ncbi:hypothetical protein AVEN_207831-1, partial [Araneus ventricosus]
GILDRLCLEIAQDMLETVSNDPNFLTTVISGDKSWAKGLDQKPSCSQHV